MVRVSFLNLLEKSLKETAIFCHVAIKYLEERGGYNGKHKDSNFLSIILLSLLFSKHSDSFTKIATKFWMEKYFAEALNKT